MPRTCRRVLVVPVAVALALCAVGVAAAEAKQDKKPAAELTVPNKSFNELDEDHNNNLSDREIFGSKPKKGSMARKAFDKADRDRNDWITRAEFQELQRLAKTGGTGGDNGGPPGGTAKKPGRR